MGKVIARVDVALGWVERFWPLIGGVIVAVLTVIWAWLADQELVVVFVLGLLALSAVVWIGYGWLKLRDALRRRETRLEFAEGHEYDRRGVSDAQAGYFREYGFFFSLRVKNRGLMEAKNVWGTLRFLDIHGQPLFSEGREFRARWANAPQPDADPQPVAANAGRYTRIAIPPNQPPEPLDIYVRFPNEGVADDLFVWNNDNLMLNGRGNDFRIDADQQAFRVEVTVGADNGDREEGLWEIQAITWPQVERLR